MSATPRQKRLTLLAAIIGSGIVFLDGSVVNVALPAIRDDLDMGLSGQQWIVEAYLLMLASLLLVGGTLGDVIGHRRVFAIGIAGFGMTSLLCAVAPSEELLVVARALQGATGAVLVPSSLAAIVAVYPERERGAAIGSWTAWTGAAIAIGPLAGGALVEASSWRLIFLIDIFPVAVALWLVLRHLPPGLDERHAKRLDIPGALLCATGLGGIVFGLIEQSHYGWGDPVVAVPLVAGALLLVAFVLEERRSPEPMLPLGLLRDRNFAVGNLATFTIYAGLGAATFFIVLYLQQVSGYTAIEAGMSLLPITVIMFVLSRRFGALADRYGPRLFMALGPIIGGVGLLLLTQIDAGADYVREVLPGVLIFSVGLSITVAPLTAAVLAGAEERNAGVASGVNNAVARVAGLIAIAAVGAVVAARFESALEGKVPAQVFADTEGKPMIIEPPGGLNSAERRDTVSALEDASVSAFRLGMGVSGSLVVLGGVISAVGIVNPRRRVAAEDCGGGAIYGASPDAARKPVAA